MKTPHCILRTLSLFLLLLSSLLSFAYDFEVNGIYYSKEYGNQNNVYVTSKDYDGNSYSGDVIIPESVSYGGETYTVTQIGGMAFQGCTQLQSVSLPNTIISIRYQAFEGCTELKGIVVPNSVTLIEQAAFMYCTGLVNLTLGNSVHTIEPQAFEGCSALMNVVIPNSVTRIGGMAFEGCKGMKSLFISESVSEIEDVAFSGCSGLESIVVDENNSFYDSRNNCNAIIESITNKLITGCTQTVLPNTIDSIGNMAFYECMTMTEITIPSNVKSIGSLAFSGCDGLTKVHISDLESWLNIYFYDDGSNPLYSAHHLYLNGYEITDLEIPNTITNISQHSFIGCSGLKNVSIPGSVKQIGFNSFAFCTGLTSIDIPVSVTTIADQAFSQCSNLSSISIPNSITYIGGYAFDGTLWLNNQPNGVVYLGQLAYKYKGTMPYGTSISLRDETIGIAGNAFYGCSGLVDIYIPNSVVSIGSGAFSGCQNLTSILIPNSVVTIGSYAFSGCTGLTEIVIPDSVTEILNSTFSGCRGLSHLVIGESVELIDMNAFLGCQNLTDLMLPNSLKRINPQAFYDCANLSSVSFGDSISYIGYYAFYGCVNISKVNITNLATWCNVEFDYGESNPLCYSHSLYLNNQEIKNLVIPNHITKIKNNAFGGCSGLTSLTVPNGTLIIGENSFSGCSGLEYIDLGNTIHTISASAFSGCSNITHINIPNSVDSIAYYAFSRCTKLETFELPKSIKTLERGVFSNCSGLSNVVIPNSVTSISLTTVQNQFISGSFSGCSSLEHIIIPESVESIGSSAFSGCNSLTEVTCLASVPPTITQSTFNNTIYNNATLRVRKASVPGYASADYWKEFADIMAIPEVNMVSIADTATLHGNTIVIPVFLENESEITAFQTDLYLPDGFELVKEDGDYLVDLSDRKGRDHVVMANDLDDGGIRVLSYSPGIKPFSGNEGELFYLTVKTPDDGDGDYTILLKNTLLTTTDKEELGAPDTSCTVTIYPYILGDANNSGTVTVTDVVVTARYVLNYHPLPFVFGAADINVDGNITVTDVVLIAQMVLDDESNMLRRVPVLNNADVWMAGEVIYNDSQCRTVSITLDNAMDYTAFQLDLLLPEGMTAENFTLTGTSGSHSLEVNQLHDGKKRLLCYAPSLQALNGDSKTLLTFDVVASGATDGDIIVDDIELVTTACQTVTLDAFAITMNTPTAVDEFTDNVIAYRDGQNIIVESPTSVTVYISDLMGHIVRIDANEGRTTIPVEGTGLYIVNVAGNVVKLMNK